MTTNERESNPTITLDDAERARIRRRLEDFARMPSRPVAPAGTGPSATSPDARHPIVVDRSRS